MSELPAAAKPLTSRNSGPIHGTFSVPGDKSVSHRALILGALAEGRTEITGLLEFEDILCTARALQNCACRKDGEHLDRDWQELGRADQPAFGFRFRELGHGRAPDDGRRRRSPDPRRVHRRRLFAQAADGARPRSLEKNGTNIEEEGRNTLPLTLQGTSNLVPMAYRLPVPSAQVKSAVLLAGLLASGETSVIESEKTRDHTEKMLAYFGAGVSSEPAGEGVRISVEGRQAFKGKPVVVPGDPSSAAFLAAAAILCPGSDLLIRNVLINPTRAGFYETLNEMGADLSFQSACSVPDGTPCIRERRSSSTGCCRSPVERARR